MAAGLQIIDISAFVGEPIDPEPEPISAAIINYFTSPQEVIVGENITFGFNFTNTGDVSHTFGAGATLRRDGDDVTRLNFLEAVTVAPGETGSAQWTHTIETAGKWEVVFGVWKSADPAELIRENLLVETGWVAEYIIATTVLDDQIVTFPDPNLEAAIREALGIGTEVPIYRSHLKKLTTLRALGRGISDLTGLEYAANLEKLLLGWWFGRNYITDLTPLADLTNLRVLCLWNNDVTNLAPLAGLTNLTMLELGQNQITDIGLLAGLTRLEGLHLSGNQIIYLGPLANLTNLTELNLSENRITDISPLSKLVNLEKLWLENNQIIDLKPLADLTNLFELYLSDNQITDIIPLTNLTNLTILELSENQITDVSPLSGLVNLEELRLGGNEIVDISPLAANHGLSEGDEIDFQGNPLSDKSLRTYIPQLEARGIVVSYDPLPVITALIDTVRDENEWRIRGSAPVYVDEEKRIVELTVFNSLDMWVKFRPRVGEGVTLKEISGFMDELQKDIFGNYRLVPPEESVTYTVKLDTLLPGNILEVEAQIKDIAIALELLLAALGALGVPPIEPELKLRFYVELKDNMHLREVTEYFQSRTLFELTLLLASEGKALIACEEGREVVFHHIPSLLDDIAKSDTVGAYAKEWGWGILLGPWNLIIAAGNTLVSLGIDFATDFWLEKPKVEFILTTFLMEDVTLSMGVIGEGTVNKPGDTIVPRGELRQVEIRAYPTPAFHFVRWKGDVRTIADVYAPVTTIKMDSNKNIAAHFVP
ncbi:leucine-rich repeat domain-containing protein, partial [Thermodesulfovibrionales bacterium]|nr:leucine-rich repeat domain-containing protein [Thermodesulfovibrionales bacterium]